MSNRKRPYRRQSPPPAAPPSRAREVGSTTYREIKLVFGEEPRESMTECTCAFTFEGAGYTLTRRIYPVEGAKIVHAGQKADAYDEMRKEAQALIDTKLGTLTPSSA